MENESNKPESVATPQNPINGETKPDGLNPVPVTEGKQNDQEVKASDALYSEGKEEVKPDSEKKEGKDESKPEEKKQEEVGDFEIEAPEGVTLDPEGVKSFKDFAKEKGLAPDVAKEVGKFGVEYVQKLQKQQAEAFAEVRKGWVESVKNDPKLGGKNFKDTLETSLRGVSIIQSPEHGGEIPGLKDALDSGWGDHPAFVEVFRRFGAMNKEDKVEHGKPVNNLPKSAADVFYGKD